MNRRELCALIDGMEPSQVLIYHEGYLLRDREHGPNMLAVNGLALEAWAAVEAGKVIAVQRRVGDLHYEYLLVKRTPPHKAVTWIGCYHEDHLNGGHYNRQAKARCERIAA